MSQEEEAPQEQDSEQADQATSSEESQAAEEVQKAPFTLKAGAKITYGTRTGQVKTIRGNGAEPYEVGILWGGEQNLVWLLHRALKVAYEKGILQVKS